MSWVVGMVGELCTKGSDSSFNSCSDGECTYENYGYYDTDAIKVDIQKKFCIKATLVVILIIIICCCCCCYFVRRHKKNNIKDENKIKFNNFK